MKVAMISDWFPPKVGGIESVVYQLSRELASRKDVEVEVITSNYPKTFTFNDNVENIEGFTVRRLSGIILPGKFKNIYFHPELPFKLKELFKDQDYDVVHSHNPFTPLSVLSASTASSMHPRRECIVMTNHTYRDFLDGHLSKILRFFPKKSADPDRITTVSKISKELVKRMGVGEDKIKIVPNGVDVEEFNPDKYSEELKDKISSDGEILVLFSGRITDRKGLQYLIPAFKEAREEVDNIKLVVMGDGPKKKEIESISESEDLDDSVEFVGKISQEEEKLYKLYATSDFLVAPSINSESFGMILIEAMASGNPVIATDVKGFDEVFEEGTGFLVPPENKDSLKEKIVKLAKDDKLREKMSRRARKVAVKKYSWEEVADKFMEVYNEALS